MHFMNSFTEAFFYRTAQRDQVVASNASTFVFILTFTLAEVKRKETLTFDNFLNNFRQRCI